jgi:hypothetical protein
MNFFDFFRKKKPRRALTTKRAARWGLVAHYMVVKRPATLGRTCKDCKFFESIIGKRGVCHFFTAPSVTLMVSENESRTCLQVEFKTVFYSFRTRIGGKGSSNGRCKEKKEENNQNTHHTKKEGIRCHGGRKRRNEGIRCESHVA